MPYQKQLSLKVSLLLTRPRGSLLPLPLLGCGGCTLLLTNADSPVIVPENTPIPVLEHPIPASP